MDVIKGDMRTGADAFGRPGEIVSALLHAAMFVRLRLGEFLEHYELTEGRYSVLTVLDKAGASGLSQSEVADQLMQSESNVSTLVERLQRDGLVNRRWSDTDRRKRVLLLTADGQQLLHRVEIARHRWAESLLSHISPEIRQGLTLGLGQLSARTDSLQASDLETGIHAENPVSEVESVWPVHPNSPHFALEQMLSTLGISGRLVEDEQ